VLRARNAAVVELLVFATHKDPARAWDRAKRLAEAVTAAGYSASRLNRQSGVQDILQRVVRYGVLSSPETLIVQTEAGKARVIARWERIPPTTEAIAAMKLATTK